MGTKIHCKSFLPGFYSMRDLNEDSSSSSWPLFYGEKTVPNGQYYNGFMPRTLVDGYPGHEKDALKQKILEHEAVFKNQVCELHRLYRIQRDMMEDVKRKESYKNRASMESSSGLQGPQIPSEEGQRKWHMAGFPLINSSYYGRTSMSGVEIINSPMSCAKGYNPSQTAFQKESGAFDSRPSKVRKKLFDLQLPADEYVDDEGEKCLRGSIGLADLNEPIQIEDDFHGQTSESVDYKGGIQHGKSNAGYLGVPGENGLVINSNLENRVNASGRLSHMYEAESTRSNLSPITQAMHNHSRHPPGTYPRSYNREELWKDSRQHVLESSDKTRDNSNNTPGSHPFFSSSCFANSWANPTNGFSQKVNTLETSLNSAATTRHGFFKTSDNLSNGIGSFSKGSSRVDSKPVIDINLNEQDVSMNEEDHLSTLPWLKPKNEMVRDLNQLFAPKEDGEVQKVNKILGFPIFERGFQENEISSLASTSASVDCQGKNGLIDINVACEPDEVIEAEERTLEREQNPKSGAFIRNHIDLNSCVSDPDEPSEPCYERNKSTNVKITLDIDLEQVPVYPDSEDDEINTLPSKEENKSEHEKQDEEEVLRNDAVEAIMAISSWAPQMHTASLSESLLWFANELENIESIKESRILNGSTHHDSFSDEEIDDFEAMTLQIPQTKEDDFMPEPFVPEFPKIEETAPVSLQTRSRRGQWRRGRQRRDFQRDILPGLASLSRHEVTEDIQTFGGLMRATGHSWNSGPTRRNGSGRGRKRVVIEMEPVCSAPLVQQLSNIEGGGLEERSITGWGKTTRRPRRQRCPPAGNPAAVALM